jgi:hypothetical protein
VILQYPPNYVPIEGEAPVGVGYVEQRVKSQYFISVDGDNWRKVSRNWALLVEPVYVGRTPGMTAKSISPDDEPSPEPIPRVMGLRVYPNPFNPETTLELSLPKRAAVSVKVFDLRGMLVRTLFEGELAAGTKALKWDGRTNQGQTASSGVYFALVQAGEKSLTNRLVLIK